MAECNTLDWHFQDTTANIDIVKGWGLILGPLIPKEETTVDIRLPRYEDPWDAVQRDLPNLRLAHEVAKATIAKLAKTFNECSSRRLDMEEGLVFEGSAKGYIQHEGAFELQVLYVKELSKGKLCKIRAIRRSGFWDIYVHRAEGVWSSEEMHFLPDEEVPYVAVVVVKKLDRKAVVLTPAQPVAAG